MPGRRIVELGEGRKPPFGELPARDAGERGDELALGRRFRACLDERLGCPHRKRNFQPPLVVAGGVADADEMDVVVDDAGNDGAAAQIDDVGVARVAHAADLGEPTVLDEQRVDNRVVFVERMDPAVDERQVPLRLLVSSGSRGERHRGRSCESRGGCRCGTEEAAPFI